jgi:HEAT repeat protein
MNTDLESQRDRLEAELMQVDTDIVKIDIQLASNDRSEDWFVRASAARRFKGLERKRVQNELARVKQKIREAHRNAFAERFIRAAYDRLPAQVFAAIKADVD